MLVKYVEINALFKVHFDEMNEFQSFYPHFFKSTNQLTHYKS